MQSCNVHYRPDYRSRHRAKGNRYEMRRLLIQTGTARTLSGLNVRRMHPMSLEDCCVEGEVQTESTPKGSALARSSKRCEGFARLMQHMQTQRPLHHSEPPAVKTYCDVPFMLTRETLDSKMRTTFCVPPLAKRTIDTATGQQSTFHRLQGQVACQYTRDTHIRANKR